MEADFGRLTSHARSQRSKALRWLSAQKKIAFSMGNCDSVVSAQPGKDTALWTTECPKDLPALLAGLPELLPSLESIYKDIHAHPELSMQETRTAAIAADHLRAVGYEVTTGVGNTGVVALLRNGEGPVVMLRADMDALPVQEATGLPYASKATATELPGRLCR